MKWKIKNKECLFASGSYFIVDYCKKSDILRPPEINVEEFLNRGIVLSKFCPHRLAWLGRVLLMHVTPVQIRLGVRFWFTLIE